MDSAQDRLVMKFDEQETLEAVLGFLLFSPRVSKGIRCWGDKHDGEDGIWSLYALIIHEHCRSLAEHFLNDKSKTRLSWLVHFGYDGRVLQWLAEQCAGLTEEEGVSALYRRSVLIAIIREQLKLYPELAPPEVEGKSLEQIVEEKL